MNEYELTAEHFKNREIDQVFYFYDEPVLYTCFIDNSQFLVLLIDANEGTKTWLFVTIEDNLLNQLVENRIDLYSVFKDPSSNTIYRIQIDQSDDYLIEPQSPSNLSESELPSRGIYLFEENYRGNTF